MKNGIALLLLLAIFSCNTAAGDEENREEVVSDTAPAASETKQIDGASPRFFHHANDVWEKIKGY